MAHLPVAELGDLARALGPEAQLHAVGGVVRDLLLGRGHDDWDLATALRPEAVMARLKPTHRVIPTGLQHGTVTVLAGDWKFELTTFRADGDYLDGRRPESVVLGVSLVEDLARRDFTINALALPVEAVGTADWRDQVVDPFDGLRDLEARLIRAVGDPLQRFLEDGLRTLRACRFAAQLGFAIDPPTLAAIPERLHVARKVAAERAMVELTKLLCAPEPARGLQPLADTGLLDLWLSELRPAAAGPGWAGLQEAVRRVPPEPRFRWAALMTAAPDAAEAVLKRLKASNALVQEAGALLKHRSEAPENGWSDADARRFLRRLAEDRLPLEDWARFRSVLGGIEAATLDRLRTLAAALPPLKPQDLALDGRGLMKLAGRGGGPWLGELQKHLLEACTEDPARNTGEGLEGLVRAWLGQHPA